MSDRKRHKTSNKSRILDETPTTKFGELPNELILTCFDYLTFYHVYDSFYCLNQRFRQLLQNYAKIDINFDSIPEGKFLTFFSHLNQMITASGNYPVSMNASDEQQFTLILNDDFFKDKFCKLKSLSITNIEAMTLSHAIFNDETKLYKRLERLSLTGTLKGGEYEIDRVCNDLVSSKMKSLKYLNLNLEPYSCGCNHGLYTRNDYVDLQFAHFSRERKSLSHLETIIIGDTSDDVDINEPYATSTRISVDTLIKNLLPRLPQLKTLMINSIHFEEDDNDGHLVVPRRADTHLNLPLNLKLIKIWTNAKKNRPNDAKQKRKILRKFFLNNYSSQITTLKTFYINNKNILKKKL